MSKPKDSTEAFVRAVEEQIREDKTMDIYKEKEREVLASNKYPHIKRALENGKTLDAIEMEIQVGLGDAYFGEYVELMSVMGVDVGK